MPVQKCQKDGKSGYKWGQAGVCFIGTGAKDKAAEVGRAIHTQQNDNNLSFSIQQLSENASKRVQIAKTGKFDHDVYGEFSITLADLKQMKTNFSADVRKQKIEGSPVLPFDYSHYDGDKAAGWITALTIEKDQNGADSLFAEVEWTPLAAEKIRGNEFKFVSPSIHRNYKDTETGKTFDIVLMGAALTNVPFLRDMEAIHLLSESRKRAFLSLKLSGDESDTNFQEGKEMPDIEELIGFLPSMSPEEQRRLFEKLGEMLEDTILDEHKELSESLKTMNAGFARKRDELESTEKELTNLKEKMSGSTDLEDKLKLSEGKITDLSSKVTSLTQTLAENDKKSEFNAMLLSGKVCEAQRKSFMTGDMNEFAANAQIVKLDESGANDKGNESTVKAHEKVEELVEAEISKDQNLSYGNAVKLVLSEHPGLKNKIYSQGAK